MSIRESIGTAVKLLVDVRDADLKARLQEALLNAQGDALDLQERVARLNEKVATLSERLRKYDEASDIAEQLFYARHAYWRKDEEACSAYCPTCWDSDHKLLRLMHVAKHGGYCAACNTRYHHVYDGSRPKEGDTAAPGTSTTPDNTVSYGGGRRSRVW